MKWQIGEVTVTKIVELETTGGSRFILPQATREAILPISWLIPHFADAEGRLKMSIHALMVEAPGRRIIVDTCLGNDKKDRRIPTWNDRQGRFLEDLAAAGFARETIDTVLCTHLHVDHVGWNTMLVDGQWIPTFPNARYLFGRVEYEHWSTQTERADMLPVLRRQHTADLRAAASPTSSSGTITSARRSGSCRARATRRAMPAS